MRIHLARFLLMAVFFAACPAAPVVEGEKWLAEDIVYLPNKSGVDPTPGCFKKTTCKSGDATGAIR
jgi:hypothetical protein